MISDHDFFMCAIDGYDNPHCTTANEFKADLNRFMYLKKLLDRYKRGDDVDILLMLNHFVVLFNLFKAKNCVLMLCYKLDDHLMQVKTFCTFLNYMPESIPELSIITSDIPLDQTIVTKLRTVIR